MKYITTPVIIAFIGAVLSALGAIWSAVKQEEESSQNKNLQQKLTNKTDEIAQKSDQYATRIDQYASNQSENDNKIKELQQKLIKKQEELDEKADIQQLKTEEISKLNHDLAEAQKELKLTSSESLNYLTGGDSWCYVYLHDPTLTEIKVRLFHQGKYPLSALRISIVRSSITFKAANGDALMLKSFIREPNNLITIPVGPLPTSGEGFELGSIPFDPNLEEETYSIKFVAQNGIWTQNYVFRKGFPVSHKVYKGNKLLKQ